jgi:hypothetical protein
MSNEIVPVQEEQETKIGASASGEVNAQIAGAPVKLKWDIAGTGIWAGAIGAGGALFFELNWRSPTTNAGHFMVSLFLTLVCGILIGAGVSRGRVNDALREKQEMRREMNRMAEEKGALYDQSLRKRLTSGEAHAETKKKKK